MNDYTVHKIEVSKTYGIIANYTIDNTSCMHWLAPLPVYGAYASALCSLLVRDKKDAFVSLVVV